MAQPAWSFGSRIWAIALNTWRETMRDRLIVGVLVFLGAVQGLVFLMEGGPRAAGGAVLDMSLLLMTAVGTLVAIFLGTSLVHKELDKRTVYIVLAKPLSRFEFLLGKYLGLMATIAVMVLLMALYLTALMSGLGAFRGEVYALCLGLFVELGFVTALAFLFSTMTSATLAALYTGCLFLLGHQGALIRTFAETERQLSLANYYVGHAMYYLLPHFEIFDFKTHVLYGHGLPWDAWAAALGYGAAMIAGLLVLASVAWDARELA
jgi:ABC-type transport system involved in multi-copper enzyme maturation permease subunit